MDTRHRQDLARIGLNILYYRKQKKLTQEQLAKRTFYSRSHIQKIETGAVAPSVTALLDIAEALEVPVVKLFERR